MAEVHHFAYGWFNPVGAYLMAFLGSLLGLVCAARGRASAAPGRRARWLVLASVAIGGGGIWLMHFTAMIGFDVPGSPVRYDPVLTVGSLLIAVVAVGVGMFVVGLGRPSVPRTLLGGLFTGTGVVAMHYTGMAALHVAGTVRYDSGLVGASVVVAVVAATAALWFAVTIRGWWPIVTAALIMGVAVCGMHYTAMAAMRVRLWPAGAGTVDGLSPLLLIVPITLLTSAAIIGMALSALQAMTEEEFAGPPRRGAGGVGASGRTRPSPRRHAPPRAAARHQAGVNQASWPANPSTVPSVMSGRAVFVDNRAEAQRRV